MKFTLSWLQKFLDTSASIDKICESLTALGIEVESVIDKREVLAPFKVAQIIEATQHPNAERLRICKVNTGIETLTIVCGAPNARAGIKVVLAEEGVIIPANGMKIKRSKIREVESCGMLCSSSELDLGDDSDGIMELPESAVIGQKLIDFKPELVDPVIEVSITPNRGDCLGIYGIARELAAAGLGTLKSIAVNEISPSFSNPIKISIANEHDCPLFVARSFSGVKNCESPEWLKSLLHAIGEESISALVDITNYICYSFARPLHVFDIKKLDNGFTVRKAETGEKLDALNDKNYELKGGEIVVADEKKILALAGIMGGKNSGCDIETTEVLLESAIFDKKQIASGGRLNQIDSDARQRFERGLDICFALEGAKIASEMILEICGGKASDFTIIGNPNPAENKLIFRLSKVEEMAAIKISKDEIVAILKKLGFECEIESETTLKITAPSWRHDIAIEQDIVEEILRVYGYDNIPALALPTSTATNNILNNEQMLLKQVRRALVATGLNEVVTWSFMSSKFAVNFGEPDLRLQIDNPISSELDLMRQSILPNLVELVQKNCNRSVANQAFFEIGPVFEYEQGFKQKKAIAGVRFGKNFERNIYKDVREIDVFDVKSDLYLALSALGIDQQNIIISTDNLPQYMHPGRSGSIKYRNKIIGYFGELHPVVIKTCGLTNPLFVFELIVDDLAAKKPSEKMDKYSNFQIVERDFAFIFDNNILAGDITRVIKNIDKNLITDVQIFDIYRGKNIDPDKKSVAISVKLQSNTKTLTNEDISQVSDAIIKQVNIKLGGILRA